MIDKTLLFIEKQVNGYLKAMSGHDNKLSLSNITNNEGKTIIKDLGLSLVNIEEETVGKAQSPYKKNDDDKVYMVNPEIKLNIYLLFTANFGDTEIGYQESLKFISYVVSFFQAKNVFHHQNSPDLDEKIEKLVLTLHTLPFEQQNYLWGSIGAKYLPSVMYKVRMIAVQGDEIKASVYSITESNLTN